MGDLVTGHPERHHERQVVQQLQRRDARCDSWGGRAPTSEIAKARPGYYHVKNSDQGQTDHIQTEQYLGSEYVSRRSCRVAFGDKTLYDAKISKASQYGQQ